MRNDLFTISQAAKSCGISRSTIMRLEEKGLLKPISCSENTGYRYYDNNNITKILQIQMFLEFGMSYKDIAEYFNSNYLSPTLIKTLEQKQFALNRCLQEMKLRIANKSGIQFEIIDLPEYVCYSREYTGFNSTDKYNAMYNLFKEAVEKGYKFLSTEPLFTINKRTDFMEGKYHNNLKHNFLCCIPLEAKTAPKEAVKFPSCKALSILYYGKYDNIGNTFIALGDKVKEMGVEPIGAPRVLAVIAPYVGREITPDKYISRIALPIKD